MNDRNVLEQVITEGEKRTLQDLVSVFITLDPIEQALVLNSAHTLQISQQMSKR